MLLTKEQLTMSLCQLVHTDHEFLNDILIEYVDLIDDNKFNDLEQYVNNNINELMWTLWLLKRSIIRSVFYYKLTVKSSHEN